VTPPSQYLAMHCCLAQHFACLSNTELAVHSVRESKVCLTVMFDMYLQLLVLHRLAVRRRHPRARLLHFDVD
jgi:hypothetical protein